VPKPSTGAWLNFIGVVVVDKDLVFFHGGTGLLLKWKNGNWQYLREPQKNPGHDINGLFVSNENDLWLACDWAIERILNGELVKIPCEIGGNFMTGIHVWGSFVWASGIIGASAPTPGILTLSENHGAEGSWRTLAQKELWKVSLYAERIL
jgi:hypothetical protein